jgi:glycosyltransferase involved in cell wall biosynthesis
MVSRLVEEFGDDVHWIFAGDGPEQARLEALAAKAGLSRHVTFAGFVAEIQKPLSVIDLYFTVSVGNVCGIAAIEAALAGRPVIGFQLLPDYVARPDDWVPSSQDPQAVADTAVRLLRNPAERAALAERQGQYARLSHSVGAMARAYQQIYESALSGAGEARLAANAPVGHS